MIGWHHLSKAKCATMQVQQGTGDNHAVSAMKFGILKQVMIGDEDGVVLPVHWLVAFFGHAFAGFCTLPHAHTNKVLKFSMSISGVTQVVELGWAVLLSDVDISVLQVGTMNEQGN
jgi:hypothetical protein